MSSPSKTRSSSKKLRSGKIIQDIPVYIYTPNSKKKSEIVNQKEVNPFETNKKLNRSISETHTTKSTQRSLVTEYSKGSESLVEEIAGNQLQISRVNERKESVNEIERNLNFDALSSLSVLREEDINFDKVFEPVPLLLHVQSPKFIIELESPSGSSTPRKYIRGLSDKNSFSLISPVEPILNSSGNQSIIEPLETRKILINQGTLVEDIIDISNLFEEEMATPGAPPIFDVSTFYKSIPEFDGNVDNLNRFLACCDHFHSNLPSIEIKQTFLKSLVRKLVGRAFDFYNKKETWTSWDELKLALKSYFSPTQSFEGYQIELCKCKQDKFSVREFGEKIEKILVEINKISNRIEVEGSNGGKFFKIQNEKLAIKSFLNGLNEPLKTILRSRKYDLIQDAIRDAIEIENEEILNRMQSVSIAEPNTPPKIELNQREVNNVGNKLNSNKQIVCFKCNRVGHTFRNCYSNFNGNFKQNIARPNINFSGNGRSNYNQNRNNYQQFNQRQGYFERNNVNQQNGKNFNQFKNGDNFNNDRSFSNEQNHQDRNKRFNQNSYNDNERRNNQHFSQMNRGNYRNSNNRSYENSHANTQYNNYQQNHNNVRFRNEGNQNMQTCTQSKNIPEQSSPMDSVALDFHMN